MRENTRPCINPHIIETCKTVYFYIKNYNRYGKALQLFNKHLAFMLWDSTDIFVENIVFY